MSLQVQPDTGPGDSDTNQMALPHKPNGKLMWFEWEEGAHLYVKAPLLTQMAAHVIQLLLSSLLRLTEKEGTFLL